MLPLTVNFPIERPIPGGEVDFHIHTSISDGHYTGSQIVDLLRASGVGVAAITDHDDTTTTRDPVLWRYLDQLEAAGREPPRIVPGVEISTALPGRLVEGGEQEAHIIGLGVDSNHPALRKALIRQRIGIDERVKEILRRLCADGFELTRGEVTDISRERMTTRADIARAVQGKGLAATFREAMEIVEAHTPDYRSLPVRFTMEPADAIRLIHEAGGVAILAHPHRVVINHDPELLRGLFADLKESGLDAVECYRHDLAVERQPAYRALIEEAGLLPSGGSDFHYFNQRGTDRYPGDADVPAALWQPLEALIRERGGVLDVRDLRVGTKAGASASERMALSRRGG